MFVPQFLVTRQKLPDKALLVSGAVVGQQLDPQMNAGKLLEVTNEQIDFVEPKFSYFEHSSPIHTERRDKGNIWRGMPCHSGIWHRQKDR